MIPSQYEKSPMGKSPQSKVSRVQSQQNGNVQFHFQNYYRHQNDYNVYDRNSARVPVILLNKSIEHILGVDPGKFSQATIDIEQQYQTKQNLSKTLLLRKLPDQSEIDIQYDYSNSQEGLNKSFNLTMSHKEFLHLHQFVRWALPFIYGWHHIQHEEFLNEDYNKQTHTQNP